MKSTPAKSTNKDEAPKKTPAEWAELSEVVALKGAGKKVSSWSVRYAVADQLFGWSAQVHHFGADSFTLTASEFKAALDCAMTYPGTKPSAAAVPPISKSKFPKSSKAK